MFGKKNQPESVQLKRPGGEMATRPLHFIFLADCSGSMYGDRIEVLNDAIDSVIPHMKSVANENPQAQVYVRALKFSNGAQWHVSQPTPVEEFRWEPLEADGGTDMGKAFLMVADALKIPPMTARSLAPVLVLLTDGQPTDDVNAGLNALFNADWGKKAVRVAIAIGDDADMSVLQQFTKNPELIVKAKNAEQLVKYIKWASTAVLKSASSPVSQAQLTGDQRFNVPIPLPPPDEDELDASEQNSF